MMIDLGHTAQVVNSGHHLFT